MYLPRWVYEIKPLLYAAIASVGVTSVSVQPLGTWCAGLLWVAAGRMCYMRVVFRKEHRGQYWHGRDRKPRASAASTIMGPG